MHEIRREDLPLQTVYFGGSDDCAQSLLNIDEALLVKNLKSLVLFQKRIVVPHSFILKSELTRKILEDNKPLLKWGILVPSITDSHMSIEEKMSEDAKYHKVSDEVHNQILEEIIDNSKIILRFDAGDMASYAFPSFKQDVRKYAKRSPYGEDILRSLAEIRIFERTHITEKLSHLPSKVRQAILELMLLNYQIAGVGYYRCNSSFPHLTTNQFYLKNRDYLKGIKSLQSKELDSLFQSLEIMKLPLDFFSRLSLDELMEIRSDKTTQKFFSKLDQIRSEFSKSLMKNEDYSLQEMMDSYYEAETSKYRSKNKLTKYSKKTLDIFLFVVGLLSPIPGPPSTVTDPIIERLMEIFYKIPMLNFKNYIMKY